MPYRVGEDIVTSCGKCKLRTTHVVFAMDGQKVKRVQCKVCLSYHNYRPDPELDEPEPVSSVMSVRRRRDGMNETMGSQGTAEVTLSDPEPAPRLKAVKAPKIPKAPGTGRKTKKEEIPDWSVLWGQALQGKDPESMVDYRADSNYEDGALINHPMFGVGVITKMSPISEKTMQVLFQDGMRRLACRYGR